jgi:hypothetical protein
LDKPLANCLVAPCSVANCPNGTVCVADYCGGCTAQCVPQPKGEVSGCHTASSRAISGR